MKYFLSLITLLIAFNSSILAQADVKSLVKIGNELVKQRDYEKAMERFDEALDYLPSYSPALDGKANLLLLMNDQKGASKIIEKAIEKNSDYAPYYLTRGKIYVLKEKYDEAIEDLNRAIDLGKGEYGDEFNSTVLVSKGAAYQRLEDYNNALNDYSKALILNPKNAEAYLYRGFLYYQQEDYQTAMGDFNQALEIDPENPFAYYNRGMIYLKLKQEDEACDDFHNACERGNTNACKMVMIHCIDF